MFWSLELASYLEDAPWPATKDELIDYAIRSGAPIEVVENLQELEDEGEVYESIEDIWPEIKGMILWRKENFLPETLDFDKIDVKYKKLWHHLSEEPRSLDFLLVKTECSLTELSTQLLELELKGRVKTVPGGYCKVR